MILIVEDDARLAELVASYLMTSGYETHWLDNGLDVIPWVRQHVPDLILLDVMLPARNGLDICRELRGFSDVPVVFVTGEGEAIRTAALQLRAEYVSKPFSPRDLRARVQAILSSRETRVDGAADFAVAVGRNAA